MPGTGARPERTGTVADPRRLKQVLLNLLTNAIKFTNEGGQVIVSGSMVDGELRLRVRDNGVGMTKDEIAFAMQPFHQLDTAPRKQTGTGLGLPVTKALVDAAKTKISAANGSPFAGPVTDQAGVTRVPAGTIPTYESIESINYFVQGVVGSIPS